jgi:hypothetical protein
MVHTPAENKVQKCLCSCVMVGLEIVSWKFKILEKSRGNCCKKQQKRCSRMRECFRQFGSFSWLLLLKMLWTFSKFSFSNTEN